MITNVQTDYDYFVHKYVGVVTEDVEKDTAKTQGAYLYVPETMCNGYKPGDSPDEDTIETNGNSIFINDDECKPKIASKVMVKNWMKGRLENNEVYSPGDMFHKGDKIEASFVHGKVSVLQFNSDYHFE